MTNVDAFVSNVCAAYLQRLTGRQVNSLTRRGGAIPELTRDALRTPLAAIRTGLVERNYSQVNQAGRDLLSILDKQDEYRLACRDIRAELRAVGDWSRER